MNLSLGVGLAEVSQWTSLFFWWPGPAWGSWGSEFRCCSGGPRKKAPGWPQDVPPSAPSWGMRPASRTGSSDGLYLHPQKPAGRGGQREDQVSLMQETEPPGIPKFGGKDTVTVLGLGVLGRPVPTLGKPPASRGKRPPEPIPTKPGPRLETWLSGKERASQARGPGFDPQLRHSEVPSEACFTVAAPCQDSGDLRVSAGRRQGPEARPSSSELWVSCSRWPPWGSLRQCHSELP